MVVDPYGTFPNSVFFTSEELSLLLSLKNYEVFNSIIILDQKHEALIENVKLYTKERENLFSRFKPYRFNGQVGINAISQQEMISLEPSMVIVKTILAQLQESSRIMHSEVNVVISELHKLLTEKLELEHKLQFVDNP